MRWQMFSKTILGIVSWCMQVKLSCCIPWTSTLLWRKAWQPIPVFLPGESHAQRRLAGYSPQGRTESDWSHLACTCQLYPNKIGEKREILLIFCLQEQFQIQRPYSCAKLRSTKTTIPSKTHMQSQVLAPWSLVSALGSPALQEAPPLRL